MSFVPQSPLHWILVGVAFGTFVLIGLGIRHFFLQARRPSFWLRVGQQAGPIAAAAQMVGLLAIPPAAAGYAVLGIGTYTAALSIFLSAIEACRRHPLPRAFVMDRRPDAIVTAGPFRWVRHPFYAASWLAFAAAPAATGSLLLALPAAVFGVVFVMAARREEAQLLAGPLRDQYRAYAARTGMFVPFLGRRRESR